MIVIILLAVLLLLLIALGFYLAGYSMRIQRQTLEQARAWQEAHYDLSWYDGLQKTDYTVASDDGYVLHAQLLQNTIHTNRYIIISHGYTDNRFGALKYRKMYLDMGFNAIIYDLRGCGENEPTFCTYSENHLLFLRRFDVPFDNNMSERDLRKCKNRQKMSGGFDVADGRNMSCRILSFIESCKRRSLNVFDAICSAFSSPVLVNG